MADVHLTVNVAGYGSSVRFYVDYENKLLSTETVDVVNGYAIATFHAKKPHLWYPSKYGPQTFYNITACLFEANDLLDRSKKRIGLRLVKLVEEELPGSQGKSFFLFGQQNPHILWGSNWIPPHSFLTQVPSKCYRDWVEMAVRGNQSMLRVWGGGVYGDDAFYDVCDELGVLVWQDFMFACGNYPANQSFLDSVEREATAAVRRLRDHPSLVIWAGNNEDYQYAESEGLGYDPNQKDPSKWLQSSFPARYIYEKILKEVLMKEDPRAIYHPGSPFGGKSSSDATIGDIHQWNIWHGKQRRYQDADKLGGRFVSEFGMQGYPDLRTVRSFFADDKLNDFYPESSTTSWHNKAVGHDRRLAIYMAENLRYSFSPWTSYIYSTQVMQAECIATAFRSWRRDWRDTSRSYCGGALVWQLNDCWPCISWSIVDHALRPKLSYYALKREMESIIIGMKRDISEEADIACYNKFARSCRLHFEMWISSFEMTPKQATLEITTADLDSGELASHKNLTRKVNILPNQTTLVDQLQFPADGDGMQTVVSASLLDDKGRLLARAINWPEPLKYAHMPARAQIEINLNVLRDGIKTSKKGHRHANPSPQLIWLSLQSNCPLKSVALDFEDAGNSSGQVLSDNGFDMMPHQSHRVRIIGRKNGPATPKLRVNWVGKDLEQDEAYAELEVVIRDSIPDEFR